jgi:hypothetical protein
MKTKSRLLKSRVEEIDNEKVKDIKTIVRVIKDGADLELKFEGKKIGIGYDGCGTHTHKD